MFWWSEVKEVSSCLCNNGRERSFTLVECVEYCKRTTKLYSDFWARRPFLSCTCPAVLSSFSVCLVVCWKSALEFTRWRRSLWRAMAFWKDSLGVARETWVCVHVLIDSIKSSEVMLAIFLCTLTEGELGSVICFEIRFEMRSSLITFSSVQHRLINLARAWLVRQTYVNLAACWEQGCDKLD